MRVPGLAPRWLRLLRRHRRAGAAVLAATATVFAYSALRPPPAPTTPVLVTRVEVAPGRVLTAADVEVTAWPPGLVPAGALTAPDELPDRPVGAPMVAGEPVLAGRFLAPSLLAAYGAGLVATPVRLADAGTVALLRAGDVVDVLAAGVTTTPDHAGTTAGAAARTVARAARVLLAGVAAAPADDGGVLSDAGSSEGGVIVLLTTAQDAAEIAGAAVTSRLSVILRGG